MSTRRLAALGALATLLAGAAGAQGLPERSLGKPEAQVTLIEYASITCHACKHFHLDVLPQVKRNYIDTGKVRLVYRHFPLDRNAVQAATLAECAPPVRFFGLLDLLFRTEDRWNHAPDPDAELMRAGLLAGVTAERHAACRANKELVDNILLERQEGEKKHGVSSTPTFVINGTRHKSVAGFPAMARLLDAAGAR